MMEIYGAGMAGLIAANMLRRHRPVILEKQEQLPNNHSALLRFRSDVVSEATGIPFKQVQVRKGIVIDGKLCNESNISADNLYSHKVTGQIIDRSSANLTPAIRYIAPPSFIEQCARSCTIKYDTGLMALGKTTRPPFISTIPMPAMMDIVEWPEEERPKFEYTPIWTMTAEVDCCDVYQTVYYPCPSHPCYRISITGNLLTAEFIEDPVIGGWALLRRLIEEGFGFGENLYAVTETSFQKYGKISPTDEAKRQAFIIHMTKEHNCYSLGRFATWRQVLLDDVVNDVKRIDAWIDSQSEYQRITSTQ